LLNIDLIAYFFLVVHFLYFASYAMVKSIHKFQVLGREMLITLIQYLCQEWRSGNERIQRILNTTRIHIMPSMNPDGYFKAARQVEMSWRCYKATNKDLYHTV